MSKRVSQEDLSAYLDGESARADRVREALAHNEAASAELAAMARVSERLRELPSPEVDASFAQSVVNRIESECAEQLAMGRVLGRLSELPAPDVHPAFARRVVAAIEAGSHKEPVRWRIPVSGSVLAAAVFAIVIGMTLLPPLPTTDAPTHIASPASDAAPAEMLDETMLLAQIESRLVADVDVQQVVLARFEPAAEPQDLYSARLLAAFTGPSAALTSEAFTRGADYRAALRHMDKAQTSTLKSLLEASVQEAHEG